MNYITPEQIKEYVSKNPTGIAGNSKELSEMVNYFSELIVRECAKIAFQNDIAKFTRDGYRIGLDIQKHFGVE